MLSDLPATSHHSLPSLPLMRFWLQHFEWFTGQLPCRAVFSDKVGKKDQTEREKKYHTIKKNRNKTATVRNKQQNEKRETRGEGVRRLCGTARSRYYRDWNASCRSKWAKQKCDNNLLSSQPQHSFNCRVIHALSREWSECKVSSSGWAEKRDELTQPVCTLCCFVLHREGRSKGVATLV